MDLEPQELGLPTRFFAYPVLIGVRSEGSLPVESDADTDPHKEKDNEK